MIVVCFFSIFGCHMRHMIEINQYYWHGDHHQVHAIRIKMEIKQTNKKIEITSSMHTTFFASTLYLSPTRSRLDDKNIDLPSKTPKCGK